MEEQLVPTCVVVENNNSSNNNSRMCELIDFETFDLSLLGGADESDHEDLAKVPLNSMSPYNYPLSPSYYNLYSPPTNNTTSNQYQNSSAQKNHLLKQCLQDTSFQKKCNFKPMELEIPPMNQDDEIRQNLELNQIEPVFSLAFEQIRSDIQTTCNLLNISPDPLEWSIDDVDRWLKHSLENEFLESWNLDGHNLAQMSEDEFRNFDGGDRLFSHLELWKVSYQMSSVENNLNRNDEFNMDFFDCTVPQMSNFSPASQDSLFQPYNSSSSSYVSSDHDDEDEDEGEEEEILPITPDPKLKKKMKKAGGGPGGSSHIHLWQFLKELLRNSAEFGSCIRWVDEKNGIFKIEESVRVARLWGLRKNRPAMNYDKLSRSIRQYYRKGIMRKTERSQRLVYQFCHPYAL